MQIHLLLDVLYLLLIHQSSTNGASLFLWCLVIDDPSEFILVARSWHEPESVHANHVEPMETLINAKQVKSVCKIVTCG
jgi:hypothetical protein